MMASPRLSAWGYFYAVFRSAKLRSIYLFYGKAEFLPTLTQCTHQPVAGGT